MRLPGRDLSRVRGPAVSVFPGRGPPKPAQVRGAEGTGPHARLFVRSFVRSDPSASLSSDLDLRPRPRRQDLGVPACGRREASGRAREAARAGMLPDRTRWCGEGGVSLNSLGIRGCGTDLPPCPRQGRTHALSKVKCWCGGAGWERSPCEVAALPPAGWEPPGIRAWTRGLRSRFAGFIRAKGESGRHCFVNFRTTPSRLGEVFQVIIVVETCVLCPGWANEGVALALGHLSFPLLILKTEKQQTRILRELGIDNINLSAHVAGRHRRHPF